MDREQARQRLMLYLMKVCTQHALESMMAIAASIEGAPTPFTAHEIRCLVTGVYKGTIDAMVTHTLGPMSEDDPGFLLYRQALEETKTYGAGVSAAIRQVEGRTVVVVPAEEA